METKGDSVHIDQTGQDVIEVLHITDCHLSEDRQADLLGVNTRDSFEAVLAQTKSDGVNPDLLLMTGDLAQDGSRGAYQLLKSRLTDYQCPAYWFAGNHDNRSNMQAVVGAGHELTKVVRRGPWQIILLDSMVEGQVHGRLAPSELDVLTQALSERPDLHTLVSLHHHPVSISSAWLDNIGLQNRDRFWEILDAASNVKAVLWGHIHQQIDDRRGSVRLLASPSTCIQFLPQSDDFAVENIAPGYRTLRLFPDGSIETQVVRAQCFDFDVDMASNGY